MDNKLTRRLTFNDMLFTGVSYMVGAGIFTLMPFIIKYGKRNAWMAFLIGGIISIMTGLSFARLNFEFPVNDAEYSWILEIFKPKEQEKPNKYVKIFATATIWIVGIMGIFAKSTIALGLAEFISTYNLGIPKQIITLFALGIPTFINMIGVRSAANVAKVIITLVICSFVLLIGSVTKHNKFIDDNKLLIDKNNSSNLIRASFITIFAFTGFQSVVQLSEETISKDIIPKSITASVIFTTIFYALVVFSVISIVGLKKATNSVYPISEAYNIIFGKNGRSIVTVLSIICMFSTLVIGILGVSRLFHKLSVKEIAPKFLSKLVSLDQIFGKKTENYESNVNNNNNSNSESNSMFDKMPIPALLTVFIFAYLLTFVKGGVLELMANATNSMLFFIFSTVNLLVIVNYYKTRNDENRFMSDDAKLNKWLHVFPWYAIIGFILALIFLIISPKFYKIN
jgi:basic amino acid/polyamine antiporter, APA family